MFNITVENLEALLPTQREVNRKVNEKIRKETQLNGVYSRF